MQKRANARISRPLNGSTVERFLLGAATEWSVTGGKGASRAFTSGIAFCPGGEYLTVTIFLKSLLERPSSLCGKGARTKAFCLGDETTKRGTTMDRRDFLKTAVTGSLAAGSATALGSYAKILNWNEPGPAYDLVAVKGGEPDVMFDKAMESLGGMGTFVARGKTVLVKPNIGWDVEPEMGGNTNPALVHRIISHCFWAGASKVFVFDHSCDRGSKTYVSSGIERAAKAAGATVVSGASEGYYQEVKVPRGKVLTEAKVHELLLSADVFINVPILKDHASSKLTIGMKNLMGVVWDRGFWHRNDLHQCIADFASYRKPDLIVVDAYYVMKQNGPRGTSMADVVTMKSQLVSTDLVAADAAAAKLYGLEPDDIPHIRMADEMKLGRKDLSKLSINRIRL